MSDANKLLVISNDAGQADVRKNVLEAAGFTVIAARNFRQVQQACEAAEFRLVVIGYSIPAKEKRRIWAELVTRCPQTEILELLNGTGPDIPDAHYFLPAQAGPEAIPKKIAEILRTSQPE